MAIRVSVSRGSRIPNRGSHASALRRQGTILPYCCPSRTPSRVSCRTRRLCSVAAQPRPSRRISTSRPRHGWAKTVESTRNWFQSVLQSCSVLIPLSLLALWSTFPCRSLAVSTSPVNVTADVARSATDTDITVQTIIRYRFQRLMSRQLFGKLLAVLLSAFPVVLLGGICYTFISGTKLSDSMFKAYSIIGDVPGADAVQEDNPLALWVGNLIFLWGVLTVAVTIGIVCDDISTYVSDVRHGNYQMVEKNHMVILNVNRLIGPILHQIAEAGKERDKFKCPIVVLADVDKEELEEEIQRASEGLNLTIFTRRGCTHDAMDLKRVAAGKAKYIVWLEPEDEDDMSLAARRACAIASVKTLGHGRTESAKLVVQTSHNSVNSAEQLTDVPLAFRTPPIHVDHRLDVMELYEQENFDRLLAQCALQPGLSGILSDVCHHSNGKEFYVSSGKGFGGRLYADARRYFHSAAVCGIFTPEDGLDAQGEVRLNPPDDTVLQTSDRLILLCDSYKETYPATSQLPPTAISIDPIEDDRRPHYSKNIVVLCFGKEGYVDSGAVESIAMFAPKGTKVTVVAKSTVDTTGKTGRCKVSYVEGNPASFSTLKKLSHQKIDSVVLAGLEDLPQKIADAQLISSLIQIQEAANLHWKDQGGPNVVSPLNFRDTKQVADHLIAQGHSLKVPVGLDVLLPTELISGMLVQVTATPMLDTVFKELMKVAGSEIYIRHASEFGLVDRSLMSYEVTDIVRRHDESFLGILKKDGTFETATSAMSRHSFMDGEKIVVLAGAFDASTDS